MTIETEVEFVSKTPAGIPHICKTENDEGWGIAIIYAERRKQLKPYLAHVVSPKDEETMFQVSLNKSTMNLEYKHMEGPELSDELTAWLKRTAEMYDNVLEGLGE